MADEETKVAEATEEPTEGKETAVAPGDETAAGESAPPEGKAETDEQPSGEDEEKDEEGKPKRKGGYKRRIEKLEARLEAQREDADYWRRMALGKAESPKAEAPVDEPEPKPEDFRLGDGETYDHAAFTKAMAQWTAKQLIRQQFADQAKAKETETRAEQQQREAKEWRDRETTFADSVEDYDEIADVAMGTIQQTNSPAIAEIGKAITVSERGPELLYYLGQNPDEAKRIAALSPTRAVMALGQLETRLAEQDEENPGEKTETTSPPVSRAPKPVTPVKKPSGGTKAKADDPATHHLLSDDEWTKQRGAEMRSYRKGK